MPIATRRSRRNPQHSGCFLQAEAPEIPHLHDFGLPRGLLVQPVQRQIYRQLLACPSAGMEQTLTSTFQFTASGYVGTPATATTPCEPPQSTGMLPSQGN